jgi:hypothetical protein
LLLFATARCEAADPCLDNLPTPTPLLHRVVQLVNCSNQRVLGTANAAPNDQQETPMLEKLPDSLGHALRGGFLPPVPLPSRMWAAGKMESLAPLLIGLLFLSSYSHAQLPNLSIDSDFISMDGDPGNVTLKIYIQNSGDSVFLGGLLGIYASLDTLLDTNEDSLFISIVLLSIPANDTGSFYIKLPFCSPVIQSLLPQYAFDNSFYLVYWLDIGQNYFESNENDNTGVFDTPLFISCTLGVNEATNPPLSIYPNPNDGRFNLTLPSTFGSDASLVVQNILTQQSYSLDVAGNVQNKNFDLSFLPAGIYILQIMNGANVYTRKLFKS